MKSPRSFPWAKGFRFPGEIIACVVWTYYRFALSTADVEDLLAERGVFVSRKPFASRLIASAAILPTVSARADHSQMTKGTSKRSSSSSAERSSDFGGQLMQTAMFLTFWFKLVVTLRLPNGFSQTGEAIRSTTCGRDG
jgi:hypothetical protein